MLINTIKSDIIKKGDKNAKEYKIENFLPLDDSIRKVIYLSVKEISKKWTMPIHDWGLAYTQLLIYFEDRSAA